MSCNTWKKKRQVANADEFMKDLVTFCENEKVPFVTFRDWTSITQTCKDIAAGNITLQEAARGRI